MTAQAVRRGIAAGLLVATALFEGCATDGTSGGGAYYSGSSWFYGGCCDDDVDVDVDVDMGPPSSRPPRPEQPIAKPPDGPPRPSNPIASPPKASPAPRGGARGGGGRR
jgi:hypothetical protein